MKKKEFIDYLTKNPKLIEVMKILDTEGKNVIYYFKGQRQNTKKPLVYIAPMEMTTQKKGKKIVSNQEAIDIENILAQFSVKGLLEHKTYHVKKDNMSRPYQFVSKDYILYAMRSEFLPRSPYFKPNIELRRTLNQIIREYDKR